VLVKIVPNLVSIHALLGIDRKLVVMVLVLELVPTLAKMLVHTYVLVVMGRQIFVIVILILKDVIQEVKINEF
jgi:hypothetical protein